jgi:hypothetical protein
MIDVKTERWIKSTIRGALRRRFWDTTMGTTRQPTEQEQAQVLDELRADLGRHIAVPS